MILSTRPYQVQTRAFTEIENLSVSASNSLDKGQVVTLTMILEGASETGTHKKMKLVMSGEEALDLSRRLAHYVEVTKLSAKA